MLRSIVAAAASIAFATTAFAQSAADALEQLGLLGRSAQLCDQPASGSNPHIFFERSGSGTVYRLELGARTIVVQVERVHPLRPGRAVMHIGPADVGQLSFEVFMAIQRGRWRVDASIGSDGKEYIRHGIVLANGQPNPWVSRCRD